MAKLRAANAGTVFVPANETDRKQVCDVKAGVFGWLKPRYVKHMKQLEGEQLSAWLSGGTDAEPRLATDFDERVWSRRSKQQQRIHLLVALDRAITDFNTERRGSISTVWRRTGQSDLFTVQRLLKALPHRERLLKGVREQAQRHRAKEKQQVDLVVERTKMGRRAGDAVAALTLPAAPAGAGRPGQWRPVADLAEGRGLQPGMYLFATAAFFDYPGNDLDVKDRQGRVTTMYENGRQLLPCIKWSDVPGAAKPHGGVG